MLLPSSSSCSRCSALHSRVHWLMQSVKPDVILCGWPVAAGGVAGVSTGGVGVPAAIPACNAAQGACTAACVAAGLSPTL